MMAHTLLYGCAVCLSSHRCRDAEEYVRATNVSLDNGNALSRGSVPLC